MNLLNKHFTLTQNNTWCKLFVDYTGNRYHIHKIYLWIAARLSLIENVLCFRNTFRVQPFSSKATDVMFSVESVCKHNSNPNISTWLKRRSPNGIDWMTCAKWACGKRENRFAIVDAFSQPTYGFPLCIARIYAHALMHTPTQISRGWDREPMPISKRTKTIRTFVSEEKFWKKNILHFTSFFPIARFHCKIYGLFSVF